jgi:RNA polymerase sigma-70 factor (ECF subfamily)
MSPLVVQVSGNRGTGFRIQRCTPVAKHNVPPHGSDAWARFEAEAMPHIDRLFRMAMWFERDRAAAEDAVQEALLQALRSFHRFEPGTNCRAWLVTILQRVLSNRRRAAMRSLIIDTGEERLEPTFIAPAAPHVTDEEMLAAIRRLPVTFQEVLILADVEEFSYKEIADALAIPMGTVMSRLHRARGLLRQDLLANSPLLVAPQRRSQG